MLLSFNSGLFLPSFTSFVYFYRICRFFFMHYIKKEIYNSLDRLLVDRSDKFISWTQQENQGRLRRELDEANVGQESGLAK